MTNKTYYVEYTLRFADGLNEFKGFILAETKIDAQQQINQIAYDLNADETIIDVVELANKYKWKVRV